MFSTDVLATLFNVGPLDRTQPSHFSQLPRRFSCTDRKKLHSFNLHRSVYRTLVPCKPSWPPPHEDVELQPRKRCKDVGNRRGPSETAKNVGHSVAKGTKKAANTVADALTPDTRCSESRRNLTEHRIDMATSLKPAKQRSSLKTRANTSITSRSRETGPTRSFYRVSGRKRPKFCMSP